MLLAAGFVCLIGVARLRIWRIAPRTRRLTLGMLAFAVASILFVPSVGEQGIDPRMIYGANLGSLTQHLFTVAGCYEIAALALETGLRQRWTIHLRIFMGALGIALIVTYRLGRQYTVPAPEFTLGGAGARTHQWLLLATLGATFAMVAFSAMNSGAHRGRSLSLIFMGYLALMGIGCNTMVAILMVVNPPVVASGYHRIAADWSIPALIFLGLAGIPGFASAWARRNDPR